MKVVSSMSVRCKGDPTRVVVKDIRACVEDSLSRATKRKLRAAGVGKGVPVVSRQDQTKLCYCRYLKRDS